MMSAALAFGRGTARLVVGEHLGGLLLEARRVVELGLDAVGAMVERIHRLLEDPEIAKQDHQNHEGDGDPGFRIEEHID
ncbi:hypothetical protein ACVWYH_003011 [Bradyrhizobium sp. GM24.11]